MTSLAGRRILHVLGDSAYGGGSKVILDLASAGLAAGASVDILTTNEQLASEARAVGAGVVDLDVIRRSIRPVRDLKGLLALVRFLKRDRYDVVHTHTSKAGIVGRVAARLAGVTFVIHTVHGFAFHERSPKWQIAAVALAERVSAAFCDRVVSVSQHHYREALRLHVVPRRKMMAIPNGIRPATPVEAAAVAEARADLCSGGATEVLLCHGRLAAQKGISHLVEAVALMRDRGTLPSGTLVAIAGEGPLGDDLRAQVDELGVGDHVRFLGFRTDIDALLDACDVVVLPSLWEGLSISLMEAMARGCLVAVSDIPSNVELVSDGVNGVVYPAADSAQLALALEGLLADRSEWARLGAEARRGIEETHSLEGMQAGYVQAYEAGVAGSSRR